MENKNLDRIDEIFYSTIDYVEKYEKVAFLEFHKKEERLMSKRDENGILITEPARKFAKKFEDKVGSGMHAEGIITAADYEIYGDKVNKAVGMAIISLGWEISNVFDADPQRIRETFCRLMHISMK